MPGLVFSQLTAAASCSPLCLSFVLSWLYWQLTSKGIQHLPFWMPFIDLLTTPCTAGHGMRRTGFTASFINLPLTCTLSFSGLAQVAQSCSRRYGCRHQTPMHSKSLLGNLGPSDIPPSCTSHTSLDLDRACVCSSIFPTFTRRALTNVGRTELE